MPEVIDIKDRSPNPELIRQLESLLEQAKEGSIRTIITVCGWDDDSVTHGWAVDNRNTHRRLIAELTMLQHEFIVNQMLSESNSILSRQFDID